MEMRFCFRNRRGTTKEEQIAYAQYYQNEETTAVAQQMELVCVHWIVFSIALYL